MSSLMHAASAGQLKKEKSSKPDTSSICILKDKAWITKQARRSWKPFVHTFVI